MTDNMSNIPFKPNVETSSDKSQRANKYRAIATMTACTISKLSKNAPKAEERAAMARIKDNLILFNYIYTHSTLI